MPLPVSSLILGLLLCVIGLRAAEPAAAATTGFAGFDQRAQAGEHLNVVFFGCSLTWGANASDQEVTSYRAVLREMLGERYPRSRFNCHDGAIGGTSSLLGVYRMQHDVMAWKPDLVFVDFTANDGIYDESVEPLAAYEEMLRQLAQAGIPVVQVAFPFEWDIKRENLPKMKRLQAHHDLAQAYGNGWGDAVTYIIDAVDSGKVTRKDLWVTDGVHPFDPGYRMFAEAAWNGFLGAVGAKLTPRVPASPVYPTTYRNAQRVLLTKVGQLPSGWQAGIPNRTGCNHDWLMSRWIDVLVIGRNRLVAPGADGKPVTTPQAVSPLRFTVDAASILLFGEATPGSGQFRVRIDGTPITGNNAQIKGTDLFEANRWKSGNGHLTISLAQGLDTSKPHLVEIEPVFASDQDQELRIESLCVAGGKATVTIAP